MHLEIEHTNAAKGALLNPKCPKAQTKSHKQNSSRAPSMQIGLAEMPSRICESMGIATNAISIVALIEVQSVKCGPGAYSVLIPASLDAIQSALPMRLCRQRTAPAGGWRHPWAGHQHGSRQQRRSTG